MKIRLVHIILHNNMMECVFEQKNSKLLKGKFNVANRDDMFNSINALPLNKHKVVICGVEHMTPRKIGFFSNESKGYYYSGNLLPATKLDNFLFLQNILEQVNNITNSDFNAILINRYCDGDDYIGPHSDDEKSLANNGVVTLSFGQERIFRIKDKKTKTKIMDVIVKDCDMYHMTGEFQKHFTHEIPKQKGAKDVRISLTFRKHLI